MPINVTLFAKKGGVGKSTLSLNLAGYLATHGQRVLIIDADSQGSISNMFMGPAAAEITPAHETIAGLFDLRREPDLEGIIRESKCDGISFAPANDFLREYCHNKPENFPDLQFVLRDFIREVGDRFDFVFLDAPPDCYTLLSWNCLMAAHFVLSPVEMESFSAHSVPGIIREIQKATQDGNPHLQSLGYVVNKKDNKKTFHTANENVLRQLYGPQVFDNAITLLGAFSEAENEGMHVFRHNPKSAAAKLFAKVGAEFLGRIQSYAARRAA